MKVLVTGGARSGKSEFAESLYQNDNVVYVASYIIGDGDLEMISRIKKHQEQRNKRWKTIEVKTLLDIEDKVILFDCLSIFCSNVLFYYSKNLNYIDDNTIDKIQMHIKKELNKIINDSNDVVIVTNEVGFSLVPTNHIERVYRDILGRINKWVATKVDDVYLVVCGQALKIK